MCEDRKEGEGRGGRAAESSHLVRGLPYMTSAKLSDFWTPSPLCHIHNSCNLVPFICFLGTPLPQPLQTSYMEVPFDQCW